MEFFDRKEEVLEIELTQHGKYLLSLGEFQPVYYSFFDDDVIYDSNYTGYSENQKDTEGRIKESLRSHCQVDFIDCETRERNVYEFDRRDLQVHFERQHSLSSELGIADYYSDSVPSWDVDLLKGKIETSAAVYNYGETDSSEVPAGPGPTYRIPQINLKDSTYKRLAGTIIQGISPVPVYDEDLRQIEEFGHEFIEIRKDFILIEINENNATFQKENFEIEFFELIGSGEELRGATPVKTLKPLKFSGPRRNREKEYVDYYFNLDVDMEIDSDQLCKYKGVETAKGLFLQRVFDCDTEINDESPVDQYRTAVENIGEVC